MNSTKNSGEVIQLIKEYEKALNEKDILKILSLYGANPTFMPQYAPAQVGKDAVKSAYEYVFNTLELKISFEIHDVEVLGDTAWARTSSAGKTKILAIGDIVSEGNNELFVFKKESGSWKIHQYIFSTNIPR